MSVSSSSAENSPLHHGSSDGELESRSPVSTCGETSERPERMRDWLIRMINSGRFVGLQWLDEDKTVFKVPWIHAKKRGYCRERDAALFREWALHSGKYRVDSDPTVWKINFRCAINGLKDIMEIKDMQTEDCRVYKVLPSRSKRRRRNRPRTEPYPTAMSRFATSEGLHLAPAASMYNSYAHLPPQYSVGIAPTSTDSLYTPPYTPAPVKMEYPSCSSVMTSCIQQHLPSSSSSYTSYPTMSSSKGVFFGDHIQTTAHQQAPPTSTIPIRRQDSPDSGYGNGEQQNSPLMSQPTPSPPLVQQHSPLLAQLNSPPAQQPSPLTLPTEQDAFPPTDLSYDLGSPSFDPATSPASVVTSDDSKVVEIIGDLEVNPPTPPLSAAPPSGELEIRILYGSITVFSQTIDCTKGCQILSAGGSSWPDESLPDMQKVILPENHPQEESRKIFDAMRRGVVIEATDGNIYVTPRCRTVVYCSGSASEPPLELHRDIPLKVFDYNGHFRPALEHYAFIQDRAPTPYVILGLGQSWGVGHHAANNYISVVITHSKARHEVNSIALPHTLTQDLLLDLPESFDIKEPNAYDLEAEAFLNQIQSVVN